MAKQPAERRELSAGDQSSSKASGTGVVESGSGRSAGDAERPVAGPRKTAKVALVGPEIEENLSLRYIASSLARAGHEALIIPHNHGADFGVALAAVIAAAPEVVGLSLAFQWRAQDFLALAVALREFGYSGHITLGGHFATFAAAEILADFPEVSSICRQEAEETLVSLVAAVTEGRPLDEIAGLAFRSDDGAQRFTGMPSLPDLAALPRPDRRGKPASCFGHGIAPLVASRGCYANCSFCCIAAWHEQTLPGKRYRLRDVADVADEMAELQETRGIDVFVFHDDNFFLPGHKKNLERLTALADALDARGIGRFATVVKARPTDVDMRVFRVLTERLGCIRCYVGVESDADQGLETLQRWASAKQNKKAIEVVRELDLYTCFNMLLFDPDTNLDSIATNIEFLRYASEYPSNFGRVELYAGTPLLARMQAEGRTRGDYLMWDYDLASPEVTRVFNLAMRCFWERNFGDDALANRIMGTRFDIEVVRHFHPEVMLSRWGAEGKALSRTLGEDGAAGLEAILRFVERGAPESAEAEFVAELSLGLRATEDDVRARCRALAAEMKRAVGRGEPLTEMGDRVATPLQTQRAVG